MILLNSLLKHTSRGCTKLVQPGGTRTSDVCVSRLRMSLTLFVVCTLCTSAIKSFGRSASGLNGCFHMCRHLHVQVSQCTCTYRCRHMVSIILLIGPLLRTNLVVIEPSDVDQVIIPSIDADADTTLLESLNRYVWLLVHFSPRRSHPLRY